MKRTTTKTMGVVLSVLLCGCGTARSPQIGPTPDIPPTWSRDVDTTAAIDSDRLARWWEGFGDAELSQVLQQIAAQNLDVKTARSRVREARAQVGAARGNRMPAVSAGLSGSASQSSTQNNLQQSYTLGLDASWDVDVFGERRSDIAATAVAAEAVSFDLEDVLTAAMADGAAYYIAIRALEERIGLAEQSARLQADTLEIARFRVQAGLGTELDIFQARVNLESTRAQVADLQIGLSQRIHALSVLQGAAPTALTLARPARAGIPSPPIDVAIGIPAEALRRRPDVRAAERRVVAQTHRADAARARLKPRFSLVGSIGLETLNIARLLVPGAGFFRVSPSVTTNVFDRRQLKQNVIVADEQVVQGALQYETVALRALQEVEDALAAYAQEQVRQEHLRDAVAAAQQASGLTTNLYNSGLRDFRDVLDAQQSLVLFQDQLALSRANVSTAVVRLYRAIGGGWTALPRQ